MKLVNTSKRARGVSLHETIVLEPGEEIDVSEYDLAKFRKSQLGATWLAQGAVTVREGPAVPRKVKDPNVRLAPPLPKGITGIGVELLHRGSGWWRVYVNGMAVTDTNMKKEAAEELANEYRVM